MLPHIPGIDLRSGELSAGCLPWSVHLPRPHDLPQYPISGGGAFTAWGFKVGAVGLQ